MSIADDHMPDEGGDDLLAAEYVLGVLSAEERAAAARRIEAEPAFARTVERWERHFGPMADAYQSAEPPASVKAALDRRLFPQAPGQNAARAGLWSSLALWRGLASAAVAAMLALAVVTYVVRPPLEPQARYVASLAADGSDVRYLAFYDPATGEVGLSHVSGDRATGRDFELWMIEGGQAPVSMGVIPVGASVHVPVSEATRQKLAQGAVLAVSLEPAGGSPTGQPTGPVVAAGDLRAI
jgi:anti-sigma-K factor RskA